MTANSDNAFDDFFDSVDNIHTDISGNTIAVSIVADNFPTDPAPHIKQLLDNGLATYFKVIHFEGRTLAALEVVEPRYTYYRYRYMGKLSNEEYVQLLDALSKSTPIDEDKRYTASLSVDKNRYVYLNWDIGRVLIHDLGNKRSSQRKLLVITLIQNSGQMFTSKKLREDCGIEKLGKGYKDMLTTSFVTGGLRQAFMVSGSKNDVGIRPHVDVSGKQLISIIREQLLRIERVDKPHFKTKIMKIDIVKLTQFLETTKNRQE